MHQTSRVAAAGTIVSLSLLPAPDHGAAAQKPGVGLDEMLPRAQLVMVARVERAEQISPPRKDSAGEWLPARHSVTVTPGEVLRFSPGEKLTFETDGLTFAPGENYVLMLTLDPSDAKAASKVKYVSTPAALVPGDKDSVDRVKSLLK